jgi:aspartate 1-decarboxylase
LAALVICSGKNDIIATFYHQIIIGMQLTLLKAKLHKANVTHSELEYEGSCAIDSALLEAAGIHEYEQIHIYNINNGERFTTYAIRAEAGSGTISVNGAAAHKANPGDRVIICAYVELARNEVANFKPALVYLDEDNQIVRTSNKIPVQVA